eukprot:scaffold4240_cov120-Isochrysis_galbana.AAC.14
MPKSSIAVATASRQRKSGSEQLPAVVSTSAKLEQWQARKSAARAAGRRALSYSWGRVATMRPTASCAPSSTVPCLFVHPLRTRPAMPTRCRNGSAGAARATTESSRLKSTW